MTPFARDQLMTQYGQRPGTRIPMWIRLFKLRWGLFADVCILIGAIVGGQPANWRLPVVLVLFPLWYAGHLPSRRSARLRRRHQGPKKVPATRRRRVTHETNRGDCRRYHFYSRRIIGNTGELATPVLDARLFALQHPVSLGL